MWLRPRQQAFQKVHKLDLKTGQVQQLLDDVAAFYLSSDGEKALYSRHGGWLVASITNPADPPITTLRKKVTGRGRLVDYSL